MVEAVNEKKLIHGNEDRANRFQVLIHACLFVSAFSLVFIVGWGGAATLFGQVFVEVKDIIARIGGVVLILFGLATMDIIRVSWFYMDTRPEFKGKTGTYFGSFLMGLFFAAGWSPCVGATLGAILTLGFSQETSGQAMVLSSGYALGMGLPFLLLAIGLDRATAWVRKLGRHLQTFKIISGVFIILIGLLLVTNSLNLIATWTIKNNLYLDLDIGAAGIPSYATAIFAGLLSFLSPCVLPLVPAYLGYLSGHAISAVPQER